MDGDGNMIKKPQVGNISNFSLVSNSTFLLSSFDFIV